MRKIPIKIVKLSDDIKIPLLVNPKDAYIQIQGAQQEFEWLLVGNDKAEITIKYKDEGGGTNGLEITKGAGKATKSFSRGQDQELQVLYDIFVEGCALPIDPMIVITKEPPVIPWLIRNTILASIAGFILGVIFAVNFLK